ncbi:Tco89p Ecym_2241 [Eremothecium cymbalariae DBVPG|uniref:Uncharacterized protein n=1 Tax=Eremothecium cymbalariae (strain CBS 270.75 / DBVPG 7215 / KCTC 17166 / NRRL Y-17582) TaxID=931890 RepID=G8JPN3_ERECY|nr:Hypothetical protein Ecym_2241 [Eremothecium cymbalariae DBVPG\
MSSGASRGRSSRTEAEMNAQIPHISTPHNYTSSVKARNKRLKQFSTRSRSRSNANFKGLLNLHRTTSHDGTFYRADGDSGSNNNNVKRTRSYDSLSRRKAISILSMTALTRTGSHPDQGIVNSVSGNGSNTLRSLRRSRSKSILDLYEAAEIYENHSTPEEEVEYFSEENNDDEEAEEQGQEGGEDEEEEDGDVYGQMGESAVGDTMESLCDDAELKVAETDSKQPNSIPGSDEPSRPDSSRTLTKVQLSYKPPSNLRNTLLDGNDEDDRIEHDKTVNDNDRIIRGDDDLLDAKHAIVETGHSLQRHGPTIVGNGDVEFCDSEEDKHNTKNESILDEQSEQYVPDMILSQSTGVERHFNHTLSRQNSLASHGAMIENGIYENPNYNHNSKFDYINSDLSSSIKSNDIKGDDKPVKKFSTSISSLTSNLQGRPPTAPRSGPRPNNLLTQRHTQNALLRNQQPSFLLDSYPNINSHRHGSNVGPFNNFSQFLQSGDQGTESRTQQKLWLQRESSFLDLSAQSSSSDSIFLASNIEIRREFERISREYMNVRRFGNPLNDAMTRVITQHKIDVRKHNNKISPPVSDTTSGSLFGSYQRNMKTFNELHPDVWNRELEIQQILATIWNENAAEFNKDTNPLNAKCPFLQQSTNISSRTRNTNTPHHNQRLINSLQPTTRAVNRRMEAAINQQRL